MESIRRLRRMAAVAFSCLALASCGGGGGGGSDGSTSVPTTSTYDAVSVWLETPVRYETTNYEGEPLGAAQMTIRAEGRLDSLAGKTLYVVVDAPNTVFDAQHADVRLQEWPYGAQVILRVQDNVPQGIYEGTVKVHGCLDANCSMELRNSPVSMPYKVKVLPTLSVAQQAITVTAPFGQVPAPQTIQVNLPKAGVQWLASNSTTYAGQRNLVTPTSSPSDPASATGQLSLTFDAAPPGTYVEQVTVATNLSAVLGYGSVSMARKITVTYTVTPDATLDYSFTPAAGVVTRVQGVLNGTTPIFRNAVANTDITLRWQGIEYLSNPPEADGHPLRNGWLLESATSFSNVIDSNAQACDQFYTCLPPGVYTARVRYAVTKNGTVSMVYWPVTMTIVPR